MIQRMGREVVLEEAVRDTISSWYSDAIETAGIVPVGDPQLDLGELPARARRWSSRSRSACCPRPSSATTRAWRWAAREPEVEEERIEQEIEGMRERLARLETVERPAATGDFVVVDYVGSIAAEDGEEARRSRSRAARVATSSWSWAAAT